MTVYQGGMGWGRIVGSLCWTGSGEKLFSTMYMPMFRGKCITHAEFLLWIWVKLIHIMGDLLQI